MAIDGKKLEEKYTQHLDYLKTVLEHFKKVYSYLVLRSKELKNPPDTCKSDQLDKDITEHNTLNFRLIEYFQGLTEKEMIKSQEIQKDDKIVDSIFEKIEQEKTLNEKEFEIIQEKGLEVQKNNEEELKKIKNIEVNIRKCKKFKKKVWNEKLKELKSMENGLMHMKNRMSLYWRDMKEIKQETFEIELKTCEKDSEFLIFEQQFNQENEKLRNYFEVDKQFYEENSQIRYNQSYVASKIADTCIIQESLVQAIENLTRNTINLSFQCKIDLQSKKIAKKTEQFLSNLFESEKNQIDFEIKQQKKIEQANKCDLFLMQNLFGKLELYTVKKINSRRIQKNNEDFLEEFRLQEEKDLKAKICEYENSLAVKCANSPAKPVKISKKKGKGKGRSSSVADTKQVEKKENALLEIPEDSNEDLSEKPSKPKAKAELSTIDEKYIAPKKVKEKNPKKQNDFPSPIGFDSFESTYFH